MTEYFYILLLDNFVYIYSKNRYKCKYISICHFIQSYLNGLLPYGRRHITVNKNVLSAPLNKTSLASFKQVKRLSYHLTV